MNKWQVCFAALWLGLAAGAADENETVTVTGDRVSLRAAPDLNAVLLDRAMSGDQLVLKDNSNPDWVGVAAPDSIDLWVLGQYVEADIVVPAKLNVRSGPSLSHSVVGVVNQGTQLTVRGETAEWLRIAPPEEAIVWISRRFAETAEPPEEPIVIVEVVPAPEPKVAEPVVEEVPRVEVVETVQQPEVNKMLVAAADVPELPDVLVPDPVKEQGIDSEFSGILRPAGGILCKLVNPDVEEVAVCYVRGNAAQMKELEGQFLSLSGPAYWAVDLDMPFVRPVKIRLLKKNEPLRQPDQRRF